MNFRNIAIQGYYFLKNYNIRALFSETSQYKK